MESASHVLLVCRAGDETTARNEVHVSVYEAKSNSSKKKGLCCWYDAFSALGFFLNKRSTIRNSLGFGLVTLDNQPLSISSCSGTGPVNSMYSDTFDWGVDLMSSSGALIAQGHLASARIPWSGLIE